MSTIHRICATCGQNTPLDARYCPHCGQDTQSGLPVPQQTNLPAVIGKAALPVLVGVTSLVARTLWKLLRERVTLPTVAGAAANLVSSVRTEPLAKVDPQPPAPMRPRRTIHIRSSWVIGDASGAWQKGQTEHTIEIDE